MTNLIAAVTVSLATNVSVVEFKPQPVLYGCLVYGCKEDHWKAANDLAEASKTRTVTTTAVETTTLKFDWNGPREIKSERVLWATSVIEKLEWRIK